MCIFENMTVFYVLEKKSTVFRKDKVVEQKFRFVGIRRYTTFGHSEKQLSFEFLCGNRVFVNYSQN